MAFDGTLQEITVNMHGNEAKDIRVEVQQNDSASRKVRIHLKALGQSDYVIPYEARALFCVEKKDGKRVYDECEIEDMSTLLVTLSDQAIVCSGMQRAQVYIFSEKGDIKTQVFYVNVPKAVYTDDALQSSDEFGILQDLIAHVEALEDGTTFTPHVSEDGTLSWTNDGGLDNPDPVNIMGPAGKDGADGAPGEDGEPGADGQDGYTPAIGENGNWFINGEDTEMPSRGEKGEKGDNGERGLVWCGEYDPDTTYNTNDAVFHNGCSYVSLEDKNPDEPGASDTWSLLAAKGDKGDKGDTGTTGKTAYEYAQDGGYTGTEEEFAAKLAEEGYTKDEVDDLMTELNEAINEANLAISNADSAATDANSAAASAHDAAGVANTAAGAATAAAGNAEAAAETANTAAENADTAADNANQAAENANAMSEKVTALEDDVAKLNGNLNEITEEIPDYWVSELETKASEIQVAMETAGKNKSAFLWYTDAHWELNTKKSPILLDYLRKNTPINKVNFGGDIVCDPSSFTNENIAYVYEWRKMITDLPNHHSVNGNHDVNHNSTDVKNMAYAFMITPEESQNAVYGDGCYYYIDNNAEKTRYIYLDYLTSNHTEMMAQGAFIVDAIKGVENGWHIVVIAHRWFQYTTSSAPTVGSVPAYEAEILNILDAYNARGTTTDSNYFYAQNFSDAVGKVEFCIGGHIHVDYDFYTDGGIPIIITASDANQERSGDETEDCGTVGTITESAVYGIIADYNEERTKITVVGVGRGGSRVIYENVNIVPTAISNISYSGTTTVGNNIDTSAISYTVTYSDGAVANKTGGVTVSPVTIGAVGNNSVTVSYTENGTKVSGTLTITGTATPVVRLLNLDRTYVSGTVGEPIANHLDESKAYLNANYSANESEFYSSSCSVTDVTEDSVTITESGTGGIYVAYPIHLTDLGTQAYRITFDYSGVGKCRSCYRYATADGVISRNNTLFTNDTAGASGTADVTIPANAGYEWLIIYLGSNTGSTKTFTNVSLTKATT